MPVGTTLRSEVHDSATMRRIRFQAFKAFRLGRFDEASAGFQALIDGGSRDPEHFSFRGLLLAIHEDRPRDGLDLCERACVLQSDRPEFFLNLAKARAACGHTRRAVMALRRGLELRSDHPGLLHEIDRLAPRRNQPLRFLRRQHPVNKHLGKLLARWGRTPSIEP